MCISVARTVVLYEPEFGGVAVCGVVHGTVVEGELVLRAGRTALEQNDVSDEPPSGDLHAALLTHCSTERDRGST